MWEYNAERMREIRNEYIILVWKPEGIIRRLHLPQDKNE
jgi:hypothetical protein